MVRAGPGRPAREGDGREVIVDAMCSSPPEGAAFASPEAGLARLRGYREHFYGAVRPRSYDAMRRGVDDAFEDALTRVPTPERFMAEIDEAGIDVSAIFTEDYSTRLGVTNPSNDDVAEYVSRRPDRFIGIGGIDPWQDDAVREVERAHHELGLKAVLISPFKQGLPTADPRLARVFARCESLGMPVYVHCGVNWFAESSYDLGHPRGIDTVATAFPDLKLVAVHAGWPWVLDMMLVAWRQ